MNMQELLQKRSRYRWKKASKYAKYIFNDHFVIVLLFIMGALGFQYSQFVKTLPDNFIWGKVLWAIILASAVFMGRLSTLVEPADHVFLSSREAEWKQHLQDARKKSLLLPAAVFFFLTAIASLMLYRLESFSVMNVLLLVSTGLLLKWTELGITIRALGMNVGSRPQRVKGLLFLSSLLVYAVSFAFQPWVGLLFAMLVALFFERLTITRDPLLDWAKLVDAEESRQAHMNRLINLFTDVPQVQTRAKRRKALDGLVSWLTGKNQNPYQYLYARSFVRSGDYSGLYARLLAIGCLVLLFADSYWLMLLLSLLLLYVTGFQLLPMYSHFDQHVLNRLYPAVMETKLAGYRAALKGIMLVEALAYALFAFLGSDWHTGLSVLALNLVFLLFFFRIYMSSRLKTKGA